MQVSNKNQNIHFQAIIPHNIDAQKARPLIRHLSSSSSRTFDDVVELYRIFLPELSREASNKAKGSKMPDTAIRAFHSRFLDIINHLGMNPTIETIINMLNRFQPPKESSEIVSRLQFSSDTKIQDEKEFAEISKLLSDKIGFSNMFYLLVKKASPESVPENINLFNFEGFMKTDAYKKVRFESPFNEIIQYIFGLIQKISSKGITEIKTADTEKLISEKLPKPQNPVKAQIVKSLPAKQQRKYQTEAQQHRKEQNLIWKLLKKQQETVNKKKLTKIQLKALEKNERKSFINDQIASAKKVSPKEIQRLEDTIKIFINKKQIPYTDSDVLVVRSIQTIKALDLSFDKFINLAKINPQLFYTKSETIIYNIGQCAKLFNCSFEEFKELILTDPNLLSKKPETLLQNIQKGAEKLGCSFEEYKNAAFKLPALFYRSPDTILQNAKTAAKLLGTSEKEFIDCGLKHPIILMSKPDTLLKKLQILNYYKKIKGEENNNRKIIMTSYNRLYSNIMFYLLGKNNPGTVSGNIANFNIKKFIQANANKTFKFTIPQDTAANDFVQFINEISQKTIGKNIFEFKIVDNAT